MMKRRAPIFGGIMTLVAVFGLTMIGFSKVAGALEVPPAPSKTAILDQAQVIDESTEAVISQKLLEYKKKTGNEIAVYTLKSLEDEDVFDYSHRVAEAWGVGSEEANNGVLIFVAVDDRKSFIQVGRGLEPNLTDLQASLIQKQKMSPAFREGKYGSGIEAGVQATMDVIGGARLSESSSSQDNIRSSVLETMALFGLFGAAYIGSFLARSKGWWAGGIIGAIPGSVLFFTASVLLASVVFGLGLIGGLVLDYFLSRNYRDRIASGDKTGFWGSGGGFFGGSGGFGGGSGGFGGFGGGSFGGGGSGGSW